MGFARHIISLRASVEQVLRVWVRTNARVFTEIRLFDASQTSTDNDQDGESISNGNGAVAKSHSFGYHTQSLYYPVRQLGASDSDTASSGAVKKRTSASYRDIRVEVVFFYRSEPIYQTDYEDCASKLRLSTFEMYAALFAESDTRSGTKCNDTIASLPAASRLPPAVVQMQSKRQVVAVQASSGVVSLHTDPR